MYLRSQNTKNGGIRFVATSVTNQNSRQRHISNNHREQSFCGSIGPCIIAIVTNERPTWCHLIFYFTYYVLNMFSTLIYPSSGACDCVDELPHRSFCRLQPAKRTPPKTSRTKSSNTQRTENKTTDVVIHQHSRKLLKMDILMSKTCWAHNKWNKIASDIKLAFHSSTVSVVRCLVTGCSLLWVCWRLHGRHCLYRRALCEAIHWNDVTDLGYAASYPGRPPSS